MNKWIELLKSNNYLTIKKHIKDGADVNEKSSETGESVLAYALRYRCDDDIIELLIQNGADVKNVDNEGVSIFDMAITYDNLKFVKQLVEDGIYDVNKTSRKSGFTPLMAAVCYGRSEIVKYLLECGADANRKDSSGLSAKDFARKVNKKTIIKILEDFK